MSISPKLANSTPHERDGGRWADQHDRLRYQPEILRRLIQLHPYQLKFVIVDPADLAQVRAIVDETGAAKSRVVLMAEGIDASTLTERGRWLAEIAKREGYRFTPRLHIDLWGNRRGVSVALSSVTSSSTRIRGRQCGPTRSPTGGRAPRRSDAPGRRPVRSRVRRRRESTDRPRSARSRAGRAHAD